MMRAVRTTLTIADDLLLEAKGIAARTHRSLGSVFEDALTQMLARSESAATAPRGVSLPSDGRSGLQPGVDLDDKDQIAHLLGDDELEPAPGPARR